jgi:hypothetical protein
MRANKAPRSRPPSAMCLTRLGSDAVVRERLCSEARGTVPSIALPAHQLPIASSDYFQLGLLMELEVGGGIPSIGAGFPDHAEAWTPSQSVSMYSLSDVFSPAFGT